MFKVILGLRGPLPRYDYYFVRITPKSLLLLNTFHAFISIDWYIQNYPEKVISKSWIDWSLKIV